jgi:ligand-binding sensor domain-containing protein
MYYRLLRLVSLLLFPLYSMKKLLPLLLLIFGTATAWGQGDIPLGSWRTHFSYSRIEQVALTPERVYAASESGFFYVDKQGGEIRELGRQQGFSDVGVSVLGWKPQSAVLFIGYRSGAIDLLQGGRLTAISTIRDANLGGSKTLNSVIFRGDSALVATDYGISIIGLAQARLLDTYLNLGPQGQRVAVYDLALHQDTLYATTSAGLMANRLRPGVNLNDFRSWRRYGTAEGLPASGNDFVESLQGELWLGNRAGGFYRKEGSQWVEVLFAEPGPLLDLQQDERGEALLLTTAENVYRYSLPGGDYSPLNYPALSQPLSALQDAAGNYWIGTAEGGLVSFQQGSASRLTPDGPLSDQIRALHYANEQVLALPGGYTPFGDPLNIRGFSVFSTSRGWVNYHPQPRAGSQPMPDARDLVAAAYSQRHQSWFMASYSDGLLQWKPQEGVFTLYGLGSAGTSLLASLNYPGRVLLTGVGIDREGRVWMSSYNSSRPLHRFDLASSSWQAHLQGNSQAARAHQLIIPYTGDIWLRLNPNQGGGDGLLVFNPDKQPSSRSLGTGSTNGGLTSANVWAMQEDREGSIWAGTSDGVNFFPNPAAVLTNNPISAALPIYQQRPLLDESLVTALAVDGGNRKWVGTRNGLWLFGPSGDTLYHHFTTANSPLPSNAIRSIAVHQQSGEVFVATEGGLVSYRSDATQGGIAHAASIKIFPNPVRPDFRGQVGISGLVEDAMVKITDTAGFLVRELQAQGGSAGWDLLDSRGRPVATGVYLVFSANALGTEALVGKLAVVR